MKNVLWLAALTAMCAAAQTAPAPPRKSSGPAVSGAAPAQAPAAKPAVAPSVQELKFPPLKPIPIPDVASFTLPNGMKVYLLEDRELPMISGVARIRTGNLFDPADKIGLATITGTVIRTGGSQSKTGDQWNQELENMASTVESHIDETSGTVSFSTLKENIDPTLAIFKDALTAPEFRQDKIDLAKMEIRSEISRRNDDPRGICQREFANTVYGKDTPYGWEEQYSTVDRITRTDLQEFYKRYFFPKNVLLALWGDFDSAAIRTRLERLFAGWTVEQPSVPPFPKVRMEAHPGVNLAVKKDVTQTFFSIGALGGEMRDKDFPALEVMADILGGGFQSRLFQRVRTKMGEAYDIGAVWNAKYDHPGLFEISGSTKSASTVEVIKAIQEEVARIRAAEVSEEELKTAKDTALNSLVFAFDTSTKTLARVLSYEYYGYPKDFIRQYQKGLEAVTRADVQRVAKEHLDPSAFSVLAVGNPTAFGEPLERLGPVTQIDLTIPGPENAPADQASLARGKQLLARAQQAAGGLGALSSIKDFSETAEVQAATAAGGSRATTASRWVAPAAFREDQEASGRKFSAYVNGSSGWLYNGQASAPLSGAQLKQALDDAFRLYFRLLISDGTEGRVVNAIDENAIEISDAAGHVAQVVLDPASGMPKALRYRVPQASGTPMIVQEEWSDFREVGGVKVPFKTAVERNGRKFADVTVTDCKINSGLTAEELQKRP